MNIIPSRRSFLGGFGSLIAAPAIVPYASLMPVKIVEPTYGLIEIFNDDMFRKLSADIIYEYDWHRCGRTFVAFNGVGYSGAA